MFEKILDAAVQDILKEYTPIIIGGTLLLAAAWIFGYWLEKITKYLLQNKLKFNASSASISAKVLRYTIITITVIAILQELGVEISSLIAALSITGFAIAIGLRTTTNNFFNGIMLYSIKPYVVGDYIEGERVEGIVESIHMFHTVVITKNGTYVAVPNGAMWAKSVENFSRSRPNCVEIDIRAECQVPYSDMEVLIEETIKNEPLVITTYDPLIAIKSVGDNVMTIRASFWAKAENERLARLKVSDALREKLTAAGTVVVAIGLVGKTKPKKKVDTPSTSTDDVI